MACFSCPLGGAGILLLCLWLSGCQAVWRYKTSSGYYFIFSTRTTIYLEYKGTFFVEWEIPLLCTVADKSSPNTTLRCPVPGTHKIKPVVTNMTFEDEERHLSILTDVNCFMWYVYLYQEGKKRFDSLSRFNNQVVITWIVDPENADPSELNYIASSPSEYSQVLSKQFWNLGQRPVVKTFFRRMQYTATSFPEQGIWKMKVPIATEDMIAHISGRAITFQDCFVDDTPFVISFPQIDFNNNFTFSISSPAGSNIKVSWSECVPTSAVLVTDAGTFYTNDGFVTSIEIKFPSTIIDAALIHSVKEVAVFFDHFIILIGDVIYKVEAHRISRLGKDLGLPESGIIGIRSRTWCPSEYPGLDILSDLIIWTTDTVYVYPKNRWFVFLTNVTILKEILKFKPTADVSILKACFDSLPNEIALLIECDGCISTKVLYLVAVDEQTDKWMLRDFSLSASMQGAINIEALYSASTTMMLWDDDKVYYTYGGNKINGYLKLSGKDDILSAASEASTIHQIVIDHYGNTIIKLTNNAMFFLKFGMTNAVRLPAWETLNTNFVFYWVILGAMYLLIVDGHTINRETYPLKTEVFSAVFKSKEVCPYISFQHNVHSNVYNVDKRQNVSFWAQIVYLENLGLYTEISVYRTKLLNQEKEVHYEIARGICTKNQSVMFYHDQDYSKYAEPAEYYSAISESTGVMTIEMKPSSSGKTCVSNNVIFHINVGCLQSLHLRVKRPSSCKDQDFTFIVPRKHTWFKTSKDLKIQYNKTTFGCPIDVYYGEPFRPLVMLYDGDTFIDIVKTEYVLWEMNGRTDFFYNTTMNEAQCLRHAQNWRSMIYTDQGQNLTLEEIDEIWGPHNYQSCFKFVLGELIDMYEPYEILNHSGINSITWPQYYTGFYMFRLKILDPNFSFCDLTALFAVRTYGITKSPSALKIAGFSILIVTLFLGVLVFSYFRYVRIFRTLRFNDPQLSLHPHLSASFSADELKKEE